MLQVIQNYRNGNIELLEMPSPMGKKGGVVIKTSRSLISVGTEKSMIEMGQKKLAGKAIARPDLVKQALNKAKKEGFLNVFKEALNRLDEPVPLGYSSAGVVIESGTDLFKVRDRVACAGAGYANHAEFAWVPENLCIHIPDSVSNDEASFVMVGSIALEGIRCAELTFGEIIVVIGLGLLGLLSLQMLKSYGCTVIGIDINQDKLDLAAKMGVDIGILPGKENAEDIVMNCTRGNGADAVIITAVSKDNAPIYLAENLLRKKGRIVLVGVADIRLTRKTFWEKELKFCVSKAAGPGSIEPAYEKTGLDYPIERVRWTEKRNMNHFMDLVSRRNIILKDLITHRFPFDKAIDAYDMILKSKKPYIGVLLEYENKNKIQKKLILKQNKKIAKLNLMVTGVIGAGLFTKNILLPNLKKVPGIYLKGIASTKGITASHLAKKFDFEYCTTNYKEIIEDEKIKTVIITTPHNLHAGMVIEAVKAGKNTFVEKPLAMNISQLKEVAHALKTENNNSRLFIGYNRRYSQFGIELKTYLASRFVPLLATYRINAGFIPPDHWTQDPETGGGRIIGEICHFIDFMQYITDSIPISVFAKSISGNKGKFISDDNVALCLSFKDGSISNILYSSQGTKSFSKERVEIFSGNSVFVIDDFKRAEFVIMGKKKKKKLHNQDLGYRKELDMIYEEKSDNYDRRIEDYLYSTLACFKALESIRENRQATISIDELLADIE